MSQSAATGEHMPTAELDLMPTVDVVGRLLAAEERVLPAVRAAAPSIARAAELIAERMRTGGRLVLLGAGTSGRLAVLEAAELPGTFGLPESTVAGVNAGSGGGLAGHDRDEDDTGAGQRDLIATGAGAAGPIGATWRRYRMAWAGPLIRALVVIVVGLAVGLTAEASGVTGTVRVLADIGLAVGVAGVGAVVLHRDIRAIVTAARASASS